jgi:hypothetical protein
MPARTSYPLPPTSPAPVASASDCFLPIYWSAGDTANTLHTAFFHYPAGNVLGDTSIPVTSTNQSFAADRATYDRAVNRWLPVAPGSISPDGLSFAYAEYDLATPAGGGTAHMTGALATTGRVRVVDARTGADHVVFSGSPTFWVDGFTHDGVYLSQVTLTMDGAFASGLFLLNAAGGMPQPVPGGDRPMDRTGWRVEGGFAWGSDFANGGGITGGNQIVSLDLKSGEIRAWTSWPEGVGAEVIGLDARGQPIVGALQAYSTSSGPSPAMQGIQVLRLSPSGAATIVYRSTDPNASLPVGPAFSDGHGAWLGASPPSSVWLLTAEDVLNRVTVPVTGLGWVGVGGSCI